MRQETKLFFSSIIHEDRGVMDLLTADYTFVNERLARHYGIPNVYGSQFRRIKIADETRRGLLGQASILTITSYPNRTSPVQRGKWILTNVLGTPPTPPPPNVPELKDNSENAAPKSLRERMEAHRADAVCAGCHKVMDPIGFSLENFDAVGRWRTADDGVRIDPSGTLFTGAKIDGVVATAEHAHQPARDFRRRHDGKAADLRIGPRRGVLRHAHGPQDRPRCGKRSGRLSLLVSGNGYCQQHAV